MNIRISGLAGLVALMPALAMSAQIISMPTDSTGGAGEPFRHNLFHDASTGNGMNGTVLAWFDLDTNFTSTWDPNSGVLDLYVNIYSDAAQLNFLGTGHATSNSLFGAGFGDFDDTSLGLIDWTFDAGAAAALFTNAIQMDFIDHAYQPNSAGNLPNSYVGNVVTLWGADGAHNTGTGGFTGSTLGVDMVFVIPEPSVLLLMAMGLLGFGIVARKR